MKHCTICQQDVATVGQVRGCSKCHQTGAAAGMHASLTDGTTIETAMEGADPGALPFVDIEGAPASTSVEQVQTHTQPAKEGVIAKVKRAYKRATKKA